MRFLAAFVAFFALLCGPTAAQTAPASPAPAATSLDDFARTCVDTMLRTRKADESWFAASFLAQYPVAQIDALLGQLDAAMGAYQSIDGTQGDYTAHFAKGTDEVVVHLDAQNKIDGLLFKPPNLKTASLGEAAR